MGQRADRASRWVEASLIVAAGVGAPAAAVGAGLLAGLAGCAGNGPIDRMAEPRPLASFDQPLSAVEPEPGREIAGMDESFYRAGRFVVGAQPTEADLDRLRAQGVGTVINLRSTRETEDEIGFDEAARAERLGMEYVFIPLGGDEGYGPEDVDAFAAALDACDGDALVHCASGGRARAMMSAWLISRRGWSPEMAEAWRRSAGEKPDALEQLLGEE